MTQQQAADRLGVTRQALSAYESDRARPDIDRLQELAALYGTDLEGVVYGTVPALKARKSIRIAAVSFLILLTVLHIAGAACLWAANRFFPLGNGGYVSAETLGHHVSLSEVWEKTDSVGAILAAAGGFVLLLAVLAFRCRFSLKQKLIYLGMLSAGLLLPGLFFGLADPVFHVIDYLIMPGRDLIRFIVFYLLLFAAEALIRHREEKHL
ncbi:MAG: helix-turn-helix transcriptional regulator [Oscillospiraceae bacterium]|nr:helix-turn-helix transcriptional regulator [Oscillospiraceae bacterium]